MVNHHEVAVRECRREEVGLRQLLSELSVSQDHMQEVCGYGYLLSVCVSKSIFSARIQLSPLHILYRRS